MVFVPKCDGLIDQHLTIEEDDHLIKLGHTCFNNAIYQDEEYFLCQECRDRICGIIHNDDTKRGYVTLPSFGSVKYMNEYKDNIMKLFERLK